MSERRFTRLKQTLSEHGFTAAKTRETVSRELRQSLNINVNDISFIESNIDCNYESSVRQWTDEISTNYPDELWPQKLTVIDADDIRCIDEPKNNIASSETSMNSTLENRVKITSPFTNECLKHYTGHNHLLSFSFMDKYFGIGSQPSLQSHSMNPVLQTQQSTDFGSNEINFASKNNFLANFPLRHHIFECDEDNCFDATGIVNVYGQKMLIREGNASVIDCTSDTCDSSVINSRGRNGWLTLSRNESDCFLTFFDSNRRSKIRWHIEINQKVKLFSDCSFKANGYLIKVDSRFIDDWIKDINCNIQIEFDPNERIEELFTLNYSVNCDGISEHFKNSNLLKNNIAIFSVYNDICNSRKDKFLDELQSIKDDIGHNKFRKSVKSQIYRFVLTLKSADIGGSSKLCNESYFYRISLFDSKFGKISEEFRYLSPSTMDNSNNLRTSNGNINASTNAPAIIDDDRGFDPKLLRSANHAIFSVDLSDSNSNDLYLVLRVEKCSHRLQNYHCNLLTSSPHNVANVKGHQHTPEILQHTEPYAWSIRPLFHSDSLTLENSSNFGPFYRMDANRMSDEFIVNQLNQTTTSQRSQTTLNGRLDIELCDWKTFRKTSQENNVEYTIIDPSGYLKNKSKVTTSASSMILVEVVPLRLALKPYKDYQNILFIYPKMLRYDSQKVFSKARNLCVTIEIRDSDSVTSNVEPLPVIFGRPNDERILVTSATTAVSKHNVIPDFFEEIKVLLPLNHSDKLHVLFTFSHISCKKECQQTIVGYSWLPLSTDRYPIHSQNVTLSVFASLPDQYLSCQSLGLGKGLSMPDVKIVGRDLFRVSLCLVSTVASRDYDLQSTMLSILKITQNTTSKNGTQEIGQIISLERQLPKMLQVLPECSTEELIHFSQIIIQQLFKLIVFAASQELIQEAFWTILKLIEKFKCENHVDLLNQFIDITFDTVEFCGVYIHDQMLVLMNSILEHINGGESCKSSSGTSNYADNSDSKSMAANSCSNCGSNINAVSDSSTEEMKLLFGNLWFLLQIIVKSMVQYLVRSGKILLKREQRFSEELNENLKLFFRQISHTISMNSRCDQIPNANRSLALFMTRLCSFYDRSIVFNALYYHINCLSSSRDIIKQELKLTTISTLMAHEHFLVYCNPMQLQESLQLSKEYCGKHFPVYLILNEFRHLYHNHQSSVRQIRQMALAIVRNQLIKHLLDDRYAQWTECQEKILSLYLPLLPVILDNCDRIIDAISCGSKLVTGVFCKPNHIDQMNDSGHGTGGSSSILMRSTSEISSTLSSISSYSSTSTIGSSNTLTANGTAVHNRTNLINPVCSNSNGHNRTGSIVAATSGAGTSNTSAVRFDKFSIEEIRDLLVCFLCIVQILNRKRIELLSLNHRKDLLLCLELTICCFEYKPRKLVTAGNNSSDNRSKTMPNYSTSGASVGMLNASNTFNDSYAFGGNNNRCENYLAKHLLQQNLSIQSSFVTLRTIHIYFYDDLEDNNNEINHYASQILSIYHTMMTIQQSEQVLVCLFDSLRFFLNKFPTILFNSNSFLSPIISKIIRYCNSSLTKVRQGATDLLYCLFVKNIKRTRFETIVCVSRLASSDTNGLFYLHSSLNRLEQLAIADCRSIQVSDDYSDEISIQSIIERIREILKATKQIREDYFDPYSASELRLQLANSYARTSRSLLRTWLENLCDVHQKNGDWSEAAICLCQVIAILIQQLKSKDVQIIDGMMHICKVSDNILMSKDSIKHESDWLEMEECHVSLEVLETMIHRCVDLLEKAELYELAPHVLKVLITVYENEFDYKKLHGLYEKIEKIYAKIIEINDSNKLRIFDSFFRVAFYQLNSGHKEEYIYKMPKLVSLAEMTSKMQNLYPDATFLAADSPVIQQIETMNEGSDPGEIGSTSDKVATNTSNSKQCSNLIIVVTHVTPYIENARNQFEKNIGIQQFVYEQRLGNKIAHSVAEQYKKRVILTATNSFPYFLKRTPIMRKKEIILNPIDVAIDEMQERVRQLEFVIMNQDVKHLQLVLQGSVNCQVNCGPIAYANAFLKSSDDGGSNNSNAAANSTNDNDDDYLDANGGGGGDGVQQIETESQKHLKFLFEQFLDLCESALKLNERLIKSNQIEYHNNLKMNFEKLKNELNFLNNNCTYIPTIIFDTISGHTFDPYC